MANEVAVVELDDRQRVFVSLVMEGVEPEEARKQAGYSDATPARLILAGKAIQSALDAHCAGMLRGELKLKALSTLRELMASGPAATRFNAAKLVLEQTDDSQADERTLTEMSIAELEALVERKQAELKDVTPNNGA